MIYVTQHRCFFLFWLTNTGYPLFPVPEFSLLSTAGASKNRHTTDWLPYAKHMCGARGHGYKIGTLKSQT